MANENMEDCWKITLMNLSFQGAEKPKELSIFWPMGIEGWFDYFSYDDNKLRYHVPLLKWKMGQAPWDIGRIRYAEILRGPLLYLQETSRKFWKYFGNIFRKLGLIRENFRKNLRKFNWNLVKNSTFWKLLM